MTQFCVSLNPDLSIIQIFQRLHILNYSQMILKFIARNYSDFHALNSISYEPRHKTAGLWGLPSGPTQACVYSHIRRLDA